MWNWTAEIPQVRIEIPQSARPGGTLDRYDVANDLRTSGGLVSEVLLFVPGDPDNNIRAHFGFRGQVWSFDSGSPGTKRNTLKQSA